MANILLYIKEDQVDWVFEHGDIGSGQTTFGSRTKPGDCIFVASRTEDGLGIMGEILFVEAYLDGRHPQGWKCRVRSLKKGAVRYPRAAPLKEMRSRLSVLKAEASIWNEVRNCRLLTDEDVTAIRTAGGL